jgi:RNA polymerase sigma factor (sigma-70 family)
MRNSARCQKSNEAEDICQEIRVGLWELRNVPATRDEARRIFLRLVNIFELRARRQVVRQGVLAERPEELAASIEHETERWLALFEALEQLDDHQWWLVKECKIDRRTYLDVANQLGVSEDTIRNRIWRAMAQLLAIVDETGDRKKAKRGAIIAPLAFEFTDTQRAAFSAIWRAEGRVPTFGGGPPGPPPPPPPPPPPVIPGVFPVAPVVSAASGSVVAAVKIAVLLVLFVFVPTGIVAIYYFWDPPRVQIANKGLCAPPVSVVEDVVPMDYVPPHQGSSAQIPAARSSASVQAPAAPSSSASVRSSDASSSSPPIDPDEINRARRRRPPRFLPSRKK